jgi:hypothetical protein
MPRVKNLKKYTGKSISKKYSDCVIYIAAKGKIHAASLLSMALYGKKYANLVSVYQIEKNFTEDGWGIHMSQINPIKSCLYVQKNDFMSTPKLVIETDV